MNDKDVGPIGDPAATRDLMELVRPLLPLLRRVALRLTRRHADAEDLLQDVLLKLCANQERVRQVQALKPWLVRVLYYQFVDQRRRAAPESEFVSVYALGARGGDDADAEIVREPADEAPGPEAATHQSQLAALLASALRRLPEKQQRLVRLHELEGLTLPEIVEQTGIPLNTIKSCLKRARADLQEQLSGAAARTARRPRVSPPVAPQVRGLPAPAAAAGLSRFTLSI
ncbi:MAG: RNA polymerase sigma factor [Gammaproteobacteria bacterium]|nr:RNA polymerase sigma factor [Gammaproteobacteria bacterium]